MSKKKLSLLWSCCLLICCCTTQLASAAQPKNIIVFIGDGMGFEQVKAAGIYANGSAGILNFESFPHIGQITTYSADEPVTDSAAAGTALATGVKVNNGVISIATPGDASELQTLLEYCKAQQKVTGLVTTTYISHATPAAFAAHEPSRNNNSQIVNDYLSQTQPNLLFGGTKSDETGMTNAKATAASYTVLTDRAELQALDTSIYTNETNTFLSGQFPGPDGHMPYENSQSTGYATLPHLSEMTDVALDILDNDADGFFLMVEGGRIDHAGHANNTQDNIAETIEFAAAVQKAIDWAQTRTDTLIVVTSDHETGGLIVGPNNTQGDVSDVEWVSTSHTAANVPIYAWGANSHMVSGTMNNTDLFKIATAIPGDFDGDADVDGVDFGIWQANYPTASGATLATGDADYDGDVDGVDFGIWQANYPTNSAAATMTTIPEPDTLSLLVLGGLILMLLR